MTSSRHSFWYRGQRYLALESSNLAPESGRRLTRFEAQRLMSQLLREDAASVRRLYAELAHQPVVATTSDEVVLRWLTHQIAEPPSAGGRFTWVQVHGTSAPPAALVPGQSRDQEPIERVLAQLGTDDLLHQGRAYRVLAVRDGGHFANRLAYEVLGDRDGTLVLQQMAADGSRSEAQRLAIHQLLQLQSENPRQLAHLVLRRLRAGVAQVEAEPSLTPSRLRSARQRDWIALEAVDADEQPVEGIGLEFEHAGGVSARTTDTNGMARLESVAPGSVTIRVVGLDGASWRAIAGPPAAPSSRRCPARKHVVKAGECLTKIAAKHGLRGWRQVWEHAQNEGLRARRGSPHVLAPGDVVAIPRLDLHEIVRETGSVHRIEVPRPSAVVRLRLQDFAGNALAGVAYDYSVCTEERSLRRAGSRPTDADGWLEERVPIDVNRVEIDVRLPKLHLVYDVRRLLPARDRDTNEAIGQGVAARLTGLGYARAAQHSGGVALFQALHLQQQDDARGELNGATLDALEGAYTV